VVRRKKTLRTKLQQPQQNVGARNIVPLLALRFLLDWS